MSDVVTPDPEETPETEAPDYTPPVELPPEEAPEGALEDGE